MGVLIKINGATFKDEHIIGKVEIPEVECEHAYDNACDTTCNLCGAVRTVPHNLVYVEAVAPTETENGNVEYWHCTLCGGYWLDEACTQPTTAEDVILYSIGSYPVQDGLQGLYDLGGTDSVVNSALNPTVSPVGGTAKLDFSGGGSVADNHATFTGLINKSRLVTYLRLPLANKITAIILFRVPTGQDTTVPRPLISNRTGGSTEADIGVSLSHKKVIFAATGDTYEKPTEVTFNPIESDNNFAILALSVATDGLKVYRYTNGNLDNLVDYTEKTINAWPTGNSGNAIVFGGAGNSNGGNNVDISLAAIHTGDVSVPQLTDICAFVKAYGEQKGLVIE